jgi:DNA-binding beta-propeller fold protein YncE
MRALLPLFLALLPLAATASPAYTLEATVPLGPPDRWDYVAYDSASDRILIAHATETTVVDARTRSVIARLAPLNGAHGQVVTPDGRIFADSGKTGTVTIFDGTSFKALNTVPAGQDADGMVYEPASHLVAVMDGDPGTATLLDPAGKKPALTVPLGGSPESAVADGKGALFINIADKGELVRVTGVAVAARWKLPGCQSPHGLAIDAARELLFSSCRNARLLVVDGKTGAILNTFDIGHGTDTAAFDPQRARAFSANADGTLSVFQENKGGISKLDDVETAPGARTMAVDPSSGRIFLITADVQDKLQSPQPKFAFRPGTVKLLIYKPTPSP